LQNKWLDKSKSIINKDQKKPQDKSKKKKSFIIKNSVQIK